MVKIFTIILTLTILFLSILPVGASAQSNGNWLRGNRDGMGERTWIDTSRWETRLVQVEAATPARYEDRTIVVSNARTETRVIPEVRENRTRLIPPVTERRWVEIQSAIPAVSEQGFWRTDDIPAVTRQRWVVTRAAQLAVMGTITYTRTAGRNETYTHTVSAARTIPAVTEQRIRWIPPVTVSRWVEIQAAQPAQFTRMEVVLQPGRTETRWVPAVTRVESYQVTVSFTFTERVRVSEGRIDWARVILNNIVGVGNTVLQPIWIPPVYQNVTRTGTRTETRTRTVVVTPGRNETVWIPPVTEWRNVQTRAAQPAVFGWRDVVVAAGRNETYTHTVSAARTIPAVTEQRTRWIPPVMGTRWGEISPAVTEQGNFVTDIVTAARTERNWVVTQAARPAVPAVMGWRDVTVAPSRSENYIVVIAPATVVTDHIPAVTRVDSVQVEAFRPARYEDRNEFVRDGRYEIITGNVVLERDREYVFTSLRRPPNRTHDMSMNVSHDLNVAVTNISAVHVVDRFRNLGQMHTVPVSSATRPDGSVDLHFNYARPGTDDSTLYVRLHLANGGFVEVEADIPINGLSFTERSNAPPLRFEAAIEKRGRLDF